MSDQVNHPQHYGGDNPLEVIKIIEHYNLGFCLGNTIKYILRAPHKSNEIEDLKKALCKASRFAISNLTHEDSIHDTAVYAAMIEAILFNEQQPAVFSSNRKAKK